MSAELVTIERDFNGRIVTLLERDAGDVVMTSDEVATCLGYADRRAVLKLAARHADELVGHKGVVKMTTPGGVQDVTTFDEHGVYVLAFHADTEQAKAFRAWLAETLRDLRTRDKILVDREEHESQRSLLIDLLHAYEKQAAANTAIASMAGRVLSLRRQTKPKSDPRQLVFPQIHFEEIESASSPAPVDPPA